MKRSLAVAIALASAIPATALAHKAWLQPSQTVIAGTNPWITVDAAVSNDLFYFNHVPLRTEGLAITAPDGSAVEAQNLTTGKYRTVFDVELKQQGTYRIATVNKGLMVRWEGADGKPGGLRGAKPEDLATKVPKDAKNLQVSQSIGRIETFVTNGSPNDTALKTTGEGIELVPVTHPNDLFAGETATFDFLLDGKPAADVEVTVIPGGNRYRDATGELTLKTDSKGRLTVTWPAPGMYWLEAELRTDKGVKKPVTERRASYSATLEVLAP